MTAAQLKWLRELRLGAEGLYAALNSTWNAVERRRLEGILDQVVALIAWVERHPLDVEYDDPAPEVKP